MSRRKAIYLILSLSLLLNIALATRGIHIHHRGGVVFAGDSLTAFGDWSEVRGAENLGIGGNTTSEVLARIDSITARHPKKVFLMAGVNDALNGSSVDSAASVYAQIVKRLSPRTVVYMESALPVTDHTPLARPLLKGRAVALNVWIEDFNNRIAKLADNRTVFYVPVHDDFMRDGQMSPDFTMDGIHLNGRGYRVWKSDILPILTR